MSILGSLTAPIKLWMLVGHVALQINHSRKDNKFFFKARLFIAHKMGIVEMLLLRKRKNFRTYQRFIILVILVLDLI